MWQWLKRLLGTGEDPVRGCLEELKRACDQVARERDEERQRAERLTLYARDQERRNNEVERRLAAVYQRTPAILTDAQQKHENMERLLVLASMDEGNAIWQTVLSYADEHARNEARAALMASLGDEARHYNAGRAAAAEDFASALRDLKVTADLAATKTTRER